MSQHAEPEAIQLGLIGAGGFGRHHLDAAEANSTVAVVAILSRSGIEHPGVTIYQNLETFLSHPGLQGVVVVAPNPVHPDLVMTALQANKHVLVEKPLTNDVASGAPLVREAAVRGLILSVGHNSRRAAHVQEMQHLLSAGILGRIVLAEGHFSHSGGLDLKPNQWRWSPETCPGGVLNLLGVHEIDTLQYLIGPIIQVQSWQQRLASLAEIPTVTTTLLAFESGALAYIGSSYASPWTRAIRLFGTKGNARWDERGDLILDTPDETSQVIPLLPVDTLRQQLADFAAGIGDGRQRPVDGLTGLANVAVMEAAIESHRRGQAVDVAEIWARADAQDLMERSRSR
jgi:predicted dehydrogenase